MDYTFPKSERVVSRKLIAELFTMSGSHSMVAFPIRAVYRVVDDQPAGPGQAGGATPLPCHAEVCAGDVTALPADSPLPSPQPDGEALPSPCPTQILISVPKRQFHHAVDRNRVKRQVREAYRHNRHLLSGMGQMQGKRLLIAFVWLSPAHQPSSVVTARVTALLKKIAAAVAFPGADATVSPSEP